MISVGLRQTLLKEVIVLHEHGSMLKILPGGVMDEQFVPAVQKIMDALLTHQREIGSG